MTAAAAPHHRNALGMPSGGVPSEAGSGWVRRFTRPLYHQITSPAVSSASASGQAWVSQYSALPVAALDRRFAAKEQQSTIAKDLPSGPFRPSSNMTVPRKSASCSIGTIDGPVNRQREKGRRFPTEPRLIA